MSDTLAKFWLFATHWIKLDTFDNEDELNDELELLQRQSLPTKVRTMKNKEGKEELVLYVKQASTVLNVNNKFNYKKLVKMVNYKYHQYSLTLQR